MFFKTKKKEETQAATKQLALLYKENIKVGCKASTKEEAIKMAGQLLVDTGYVEPSYIDAMLQREQVVSTYMGSGLAIPHGVDESKGSIKASGISVLIFPDGVDWGEEKAKLVIGIAGVGDAHLDILANIADIMLSENGEEQLFSGDVDKIYTLLSQKN